LLCAVKFQSKMKLTEEVKIIFKNSEGQKEELTITIDKLLDSTKDDLYEMLEDTRPCASASCNNESQNFCDCGGNFEDYLIDEVLVVVSA
jgi:hypothetical protein